MKILYSPIHYVLDAQHTGSEFSWAYHIFSYFAQSKSIKSHFITGGTRAIDVKLQKYVTDCKIISPQNINLNLFNVLKFYLATTWASLRFSNSHEIDVLHHVLPFRIGYSFNIYGMLTRTKFVIGPVQSSLDVQDTDLAKTDVRGFSASKFDLRTAFGNMFIQIFRVVFKGLSDLTLRNADKIIVINEYTRSVLLAQGFDREKIVIIPPGIHVEKYAKRTARTSKTIDCLTCSYLLKRKNIDFLINVIERVVKIDKRIRLIVVGDGPQMEPLRSLVKKHHLENHIVFAGFVQQKDILKYYKSADIYLNASSTEGFATVSLEALAAGLPIITSRVGGFETVVQNGKNGYILDKLDDDAFAQKILSLSKDSKLLNKMGDMSRQIAQNEYDWDSVIFPQYKKIYENLTHQNP